MNKFINPDTGSSSLCNKNPELVTDEVATQASQTALASRHPSNIDQSSLSSNGAQTGSPQKFLEYLREKLNLILAKGITYVFLNKNGNPYVEQITSRKIERDIRELAQRFGLSLRKKDICEIIEHLQVETEMQEIATDIYYRVAPIPGGIEIDLGNEKHTRIRITPRNVEILNQGAKALFYRPQVCWSMVMPAAEGNLKLLRKYINLHIFELTLLIGWLSYTLAHPKLPTSKFVILVLIGNQGSGKSWICRIIRQLIDPSEIDVQILPTKVNDLAIAAKNSHCLIFDNVRSLLPAIADALCLASTGGGDGHSKALYR